MVYLYNLIKNLKLSISDFTIFVGNPNLEFEQEKGDKGASEEIEIHGSAYFKVLLPHICPEGLSEWKMIT